MKAAGLLIEPRHAPPDHAKEAIAKGSHAGPGRRRGRDGGHSRIEMVDGHWLAIGVDQRACSCLASGGTCHRVARWSHRGCSNFSSRGRNHLRPDRRRPLDHLVGPMIPGCASSFSSPGIHLATSSESSSRWVKWCSATSFYHHLGNHCSRLALRFAASLKVLRNLAQTLCKRP